jgi:hypothetical protein
MQKDGKKKRKHEMGTGGFCVCTKCGERTLHQKGISRFGIPCFEVRCPKCGEKMVRKGSGHHRMMEEKDNIILM